MLDVDQSEHCNEDYLEIRTNDKDKQLLALLCGQEASTEVPATERIWMTFRSDNDGVGKGFLARYSYGLDLINIFLKCVDML